MDVFFVISGFIMMHACRDGLTASKFLRARFVRVVPFYWLMMAVAAPVWIDPTGWRLFASVLFLPAPMLSGPWMPVLGQGWTLTYEAVFYAVVAMTLILPRTRRVPWLAGLALTACALQVVLDPTSFRLQGLSASAFLEFVAGAGLHAAWRNGRLPWAGLATIAALGGIAVIVMVPDATYPGRVIAWGLPAVAIVAASLQLVGGKVLRVAQVFRPLGDASYSLYLVHPLLIHTLEPLVKPLPLPVALTIILLVCVTVSVALHLWVERPLVASAARWAGLAGRPRRHQRQDPTRMAEISIS